LAAVPFGDQGKVQAAFPHCAWWWHAKNSGGLRIPLYSRAAATAGSTPVLFRPRGSGIDPLLH